MPKFVATLLTNVQVKLEIDAPDSVVALKVLENEIKNKGVVQVIQNRWVGEIDHTHSLITKIEEPYEK